jgi:pimeloyl-ACP methyl ester carboxylesterase
VNRVRAPSSVRSADGTTIAFDPYGDGRTVILVGGAYNDRSTVAGVAQAISSDGLASVTYDRRGRGASTNNDTAFESERELEDLAALIEALGGSVSVFGHSSGAVLALEAAMQGLPIERFAVYEPPYVVDGRRPLPPGDLDERLIALVRDDRRDDAVALFSTEAVGLTAAVVDGMRAAPEWGWLTSLAHTLPYDTAIHHGYTLPAARLAELSLPLLALDGSESSPSLRATAQAVADSVPGARHLTLEGEDHGVLQHPEALEATLVEFFTTSDRAGGGGG